MDNNDFDMNFSGPAGYQVFDPLNWMLDGVFGFPYTLNPTSGIGQTTLSMSGLDGEI